jgi:hypothetical protein
MNWNIEKHGAVNHLIFYQYPHKYLWLLATRGTVIPS